MTLFALIAATFTFSATATGVEKGAPVEFFLVGSGSDRDYESVFLLDGSVEDFCSGLESAGLKRGKPEDPHACNLWPVGCKVEMKPSFEEFVEVTLPEGLDLTPIVYTGGKRLADGSCESSTNMPLSAFSFFSLGQSPLVFSGHYEQSAVYNSFRVCKKVEKGMHVNFTLTWDDRSMPKPLSLLARPGQEKELINTVRNASVAGDLDVLIDFAPELTVREAKALAGALDVIDSPRIRINGRADGRLYFRAFLPLVKWQDRQERLVQPFELTIGLTNRLVYIESDWKVEGLDPRLIPHDISFNEAKSHHDIDTCFIYANPQTRLQQVYLAMKTLNDYCPIRTWYVFDVK